MSDDNNSSVENEAKTLAKMVTLFGAKKGTDYYAIICVIKILAVILFLFMCFDK